MLVTKSVRSSHSVMSECLSVYAFFISSLGVSRNWSFLIFDELFPGSWARVDIRIKRAGIP